MLECQRDRRERVAQGLPTQRDLRQPATIRLVEETVEVRSSQIDVDERNPLPRARERDGQIRGRRRLALLLTALVITIVRMR